MAAHIETSVPLPNDRQGSPVIASFRVPPNLGDDFAVQAVILVQIAPDRYSASRIGFYNGIWVTLSGMSACTGEDALTNAFGDFQNMIAQHQELPLKW